MAWETRNGQWYYYVKRRVGGRVVSMYAGGGPLGELMEAAARGRAEAREAELAARRAERAAEKEIDDDIAFVSGMIAELVEAALLATKHHRHKGQWRARANG